MSKRFKRFTAQIIVMFFILSITPIDRVVKAAVGEVTRISGIDRYITATQVAEKNWTTSNDIVLACGEGYADAVSATALAKKLNAPILLTTPNQLNEETNKTIVKLGAKNIYVIGGNASISQTVRNKLKSNYNIIELGGKDRYETNLAVAEKLVKLGVDPTDVMMVGGEGFSDALSVAPIASAQGKILLLGMNDKNYIRPVLNFIQTNNSKVTVIGTKNVINDDILNSFNGIRVNGGTDRFDTNLKVLNTFKGTVNMDNLYVANATADGYADALVASVLAGKLSAPLVLVDTEKSNQTVNAINYIRENIKRDTNLNVIGGVGVVSETTVREINEAAAAHHVFEDITSVETLESQTFNIRNDNNRLLFTVNGGKTVSIKDLIDSGYNIKFVTNGPVFAYDSDMSKSQTSLDGVLDKSALINFYYGGDSNREKVVNETFKYQVQIYKNSLLVATSGFTTVNVIDGDTTANLITDYTMKLLKKNVDNSYIVINSGDRNGATTKDNLSVKITSGKLVVGEKASISEVKGNLINGINGVKITNVKFYSSNPFIASIDEKSGVITALSEGSVTLTIKSGQYKKDINISIVNEARKVNQVYSSVSSIKIGKGTSSSFYLNIKDQYGDDLQGNGVAPSISSGGLVNNNITKETEYQLQYVKNSNGQPIAYENVLSQADKEGKALVQVINDNNSFNTGSGSLRIVNNDGLIMNTIPITVNLSAIVDNIKLEPVKDEKSEDLKLDLNPEGASNNCDGYIKLSFNRYAADGTSLGTVEGSSADFEKYKFYITQDTNNKIIEDSNASDKALIPVTMNRDGNIIIATPYGIESEKITQTAATTILPSNTIKDNQNVIRVGSTGNITLIAKAFNPTSNEEGEIKSIIKINVVDTSPTIREVQFEDNIEATIPYTSTGGDTVIFNVRDILKEEKISFDGVAGDGKIRIASNGAIFINYEGDLEYNPVTDVLLGYITSTPNDSNIEHVVVQRDGTISAKLSPNKISGRFTIGVMRKNEKTPFVVTTASIDKN